MSQENQVKIECEMIIKAKDISFSYVSEKPVFNAVNFHLLQGEIISIVGPSGTGKSTLLKCLGGYLSLDEGQVFIEGEKLIDPKELLKPGHPEIALVNQLFELDDYFTARENISNHLHHLPTKEREDFIQELLEVFELHAVENLKSKEISGGEKQRLTMACALAKEPRCLLLDEPFVHFDVHLHRKIGAYLRKLVEIRKMGVILVTHNGEEALSWSDRILLMRNGEITSVYTPEQAYFKPKNLFEGRFFGELNSVYKEGKQILFRPTKFSTKENAEYSRRVEVSYLKTYFKGAFYANYYKISTGKEIVLYSSSKLSNINVIYV